MRTLFAIIVGLLISTQSAFAQADSLDCQSKYQEWQKLEEESNDSLVDKNPELIGSIESLYNELEYPEGDFSGRVIVKFLVDKQGMTKCFESVLRVPKKFEKAAIEAIREMDFKPAQKDGQPVMVPYVIPVNFKK
ncbi:energy transducer TonB [Fodinibius halophilus]|uniref:Energy transducer TonB n=1 Tax=Fodinibius halophilus TaxID=1736908 RepID=A0A6M1TBH2_9BACT|nr:energy transducer TonB [Fodinibius halophilus]NGP89381.1 energy transducer TonB [Fodinibius halophilus]